MHLECFKQDLQLCMDLQDFFYIEMLQDIMKTRVILHNMIVEDERDVNEAVELDYE